MKKDEIYKPYQIVSIVLISCFLNVVGRILADRLNLPLWLDSFGTVLTAYLLGPVCGIIVGVSGNILHGFVNPVSFIYGIVSIFIALIVGIFARRKYFESLLKTMSLSVIVTLVSVTISVILNITFYDGNVGNKWGNGIAAEFSEFGLPRLVCIILGQFYTDFLDKVITLVTLFLCIRAYRLFKPRLPDFLKISPAFIVLLSVFALNPQKTYASPAVKAYNSYAQIHYTKEDGLVGGKANDIASTNDGILWIGAYEGLYRYSGSEFRLMREFDSIKAVRCLYVDDEGRLFVGTNDNGLSIIINETVMNVLEAKDGLPADYIRSITRGSDGLYYVGTSDALAILTIADGLKVVKTVDQVQNAVSINANESFVAAVTSNGTLYLLQKDEILWSSKNLYEKFTAVTFDSQGNLYAATESNKIFQLNVKYTYESDVQTSINKTIYCSILKHINSIEFIDNSLFVCADNGAGFVRDDRFELLETGSFNNSIDNMTQDYQGNLWFTSSRLGLLKLCETSFTEIYASSGLPGSVVNSTAKFMGNLYFATDDGLKALRGESDNILRNALTERLAGVRVRCLYIAKNGAMWIATKQQGLLCAKTDGTVLTFGQGYQFRVVTELADGTIAGGTGNGVCFIRNGRIEQWLGQKDGFENPRILTLGQTPNGLILAGTDGGGLSVIRKTETNGLNSYQIANTITREEGLSSNVVMRTINDFDGKIGTNRAYIVTSNGLCYANFSEQTLTCNKLDNFPFSNNYDVIVRPDGNIFVLSSAGIFVVNRTDLLSGKKLDYELLDLKKGFRDSLTANSWNYLDKDGNVYLSCDTGSNKLNLNTYNKAEYSYRMQIKSVFLDGKRHILQKDIPFVIPADCNTVEVIPEIINYSLNTPYISLYFEGVDDKPQVSLQSEVSSMVYSNIKAGNYTFHIAVLDSKGREVVEDSSYILSKAYRIFDHFYFVVYTIAVAMLAIIWLTWYITSTIQGKRIEKQKAEMEAIKNQVRMGNETIFAIANAVEARDKSTGKHSYRVAEYAVMIAKKLGFTEEEQSQIQSTGLLHDIGKIGVPDNILNKPARLTDKEYAIMKTHTSIGGEILKDFTLIPHVDEGAKYHHERYDGTGYPNGLKGEEIPLNARIIGIADAFDAMTANRVYRKALEMDFVIQELQRCSGTQFDPGLVEIMLELIASGEINVEKIVEESVNV